MVIEVNGVKQTTFGSLKDGDVFRVVFEGCNPVIAMKINYSEDTCGDGINAVDLADGDWFFVSDGYKVEPLKAKLIIGG